MNEAHHTKIMVTLFYALLAGTAVQAVMYQCDMPETKGVVFIDKTSAPIEVVGIGKKVPDFKAQAVIAGSIQDLALSDFDGKYKVIFFYPLDFTFVCPTELHAFQSQLAEFEKRDVVVLAVSVDSVYSHYAWLSMPKEKGGIQGVSYPLISDLNKLLSKTFGVLDEQEGIALRGLFLLDKDNKVQCSMVNNFPIGRNVQEVLRLVDALQHVVEHGNVCPANWTVDQPDMVPTESGLLDYFQTPSLDDSQH